MNTGFDCNRRVNRGNNGVANFNTNTASNTNTNNGWRPVLVGKSILIGAIQVAAARLGHSKRVRFWRTGDPHARTHQQATC